MAVLTTFKIEGDPDELLALKKEKLDPTSQQWEILQHETAS